MSQFLHYQDNDDTKAIAIPRVFSENSRAKNACKQKCYPCMKLFGIISYSDDLDCYHLYRCTYYHNVMELCFPYNFAINLHAKPNHNLLTFDHLPVYHTGAHSCVLHSRLCDGFVSCLQYLRGTFLSSDWESFCTQ